MADCNKKCPDECGRDCPCDTNFREAVCIHTDKIYDSCREWNHARYKILRLIIIDLIIA